MIRRINYTGRVTIPRDNVTITLTKDGSTHRVDLQVDFDNLALPKDAKLAVEAYRQNDRQRFDWGTVGAPTPPSKRKLLEFGDNAGVKFRIKAIMGSPHAGRIVGDASSLSPRTPADADGKRRPLLPVTSDTLDGEPWRLEMSGEPLLKIDVSLGDAQVLARRHDFQALVFPAALRLILGKIMAQLDGDDVEDVGGWQGDWLRFVADLPGAPEPPESADDDSREEWIEAVVHAFCAKHRLADVLAQTWLAEAE